MSPRAAARLETLGFSLVYDYVDGKADWYAHGLAMAGTVAADSRAGALARRDVPTCGLAEAVGAVWTRVQPTGWAVCAVVNDAGGLLGLLREATWQADPALTAEQVMEPGPSTFRPDANLEAPLRYMHRHQVDSVPITTATGRMVGLLRRDDAEPAAGRA